jgi:hypothetical protein
MIRTAALILCCLGMPAAFAQTPATDASIRELMAVTGAGDLGVQVMQNLMPALRRAAPEVPEAVWQDIEKEIRPEELVSLVVPIYRKYYQEEDLRAAIDFYRSPAGRRLIEKQPQISRESMLAGQQWGSDIAQRVIAKLRAMEPASAPAGQAGSPRP